MIRSHMTGFPAKILQPIAVNLLSQHPALSTEKIKPPDCPSIAPTLPTQF